jgi:hypothetical protein
MNIFLQGANDSELMHESERGSGVKLGQEGKGLGLMGAQGGQSWCSEKGIYTDLHSTTEEPSVESREGGFLCDLSGARCEVYMTRFGRSHPPCSYCWDEAESQLYYPGDD